MIMKTFTRISLLLAAAVALLAQNPNTARFPGAIATDNDLFVADNTNNAAPTLTLPIGTSDTTLNVTTTNNFTMPTIISVENEFIAVCSKTATTFTVCASGRGFNGTAAASHGSGTAFFEYIMAWEYNQVAAEIKAIETALGVNLGSVLSGQTFQGNGSKIQKSTGTTTTNDAGVYDVNGNIIDGGNPPQFTTSAAKPTNHVATFDSSGRTVDGGLPQITTSAAKTSGNCVQFDASGFTVDSGSPCSSGGGISGTTGRPWFDPLAYGADPTGVADSTTAFQSAINAARNLAGNEICPSPHGGALIIISPGSYTISSLDVTRACGLEIMGVGNSSVSFYAQTQASTSKPVFDFTGSSGIYLHGFTINGQTNAGIAPTVVPTTGMLFAPTSVGGDCNANRVDNVGALGFFTIAAVYIYGCPDLLFEHNGHQSWTNGSPALWVTGTNDGSITSPYQTIATGSQPTGEMIFNRCEFHDLAKDPVTGVFISPSTTITVRIISSYGLRFYGGNISNSAGATQGFVHFEGAGAIRDLIFDGVEFYGDHGVSGGPVFYNNGTLVQSLAVRSIYIANTTIPAIIGGAANSQYVGLELFGIDADYAGTPVSMPDASSSSLYTITDAKLDLAGKGFKPGGAIKNVLLLNPGTITLRTGNARWDNVTPPATFAFASVPLFSIAGSTIFCSNCAPSTHVCAGASTGTMATYQNGALYCY